MITKIQKDYIFNLFSALMAIVSALVVIYITYFLLVESLPFIKEVNFLEIFSFEKSWNPLSGEFSFISMILASFFMASIATSLMLFFLISISVVIKFYLPERISGIIHSFLVVCNAIPSVVYGFWGITLLVPLLAKIHFLGTNLLAGSLVLASMLLPTGILLTLRSIDSWNENIFASANVLGLSLQSKVRKIFIPLIIESMPKVILLSFTRAIGETMAVVMVSGNVVQVPSSIFDSVRVLTSNIALEMAYATSTHRSSLFFSGILVAFVIFLVISGVKAWEYLYQKNSK